ncbi:MAG: hypothetical protein GEU80_08255 [Dehalococcoidia bacterium]|nr:hypothetical protein [Dehalococcoidia bacterium]
MPHQYAANDARTGLEVTVTGDFPDHPDDRVRIARTSNLFTRLMATILATENETERRHRFRAVETQLEVAEALIRGDMAEVQRAIRSTLQQMGISDEQLHEVEGQLREHLKQFGGEELGPLDELFGGDEPTEGEPPPEDDRPLDDRGLP